MVPCSFLIYLYNIYLQRMTFKIFFSIGIIKKKKTNEEAVKLERQRKTIETEVVVNQSQAISSFFFFLKEKNAFKCHRVQKKIC